MEQKPLRILIVDDHDAIRRGIRALLSARKEWVVCGEAKDGFEAIEKTRAERPDVVLMDIFMPNLDGLAATRILHREQPESDIIIISQTDASIGRSHAEEIGARGYVAKANLAQELVPTIEQVAAKRPAGAASRPAKAKEPDAMERDVSGVIPPDAVPLEAVLCTEELEQRPSRAPDYEKEHHALMRLARTLAESPETALQTLAETILELCGSDSAGISLLDDEESGSRFYWPAIAGRLKEHVGSGTPRDFGPSGDVLDRNTTLLFRHPERRYTYLQPIAVEEALLVPFYLQKKAVGTLWAVNAGNHRKFDREDERLMTSLATFAASACQALASLQSLEKQTPVQNGQEKSSAAQPPGSRNTAR